MSKLELAWKISVLQVEMKLIRKISIILAGSILLMHSVLPHEHHSELNENQHVEAHDTATSLLDFIKLAFHVDLGQDHLESYKVVQQEQVAFHLIIYPAIDFSFETLFTEFASPKFLPFQDKLHTKYLSQPRRVRGPPLFT